MMRRSVRRVTSRGKRTIVGATRRQRLILAAMVPQRRQVFSTVQLQNLLFLLNRNVRAYKGGKHFNFLPTRHGPYDGMVFQELEALARLGLVQKHRSERRYRLTHSGVNAGESVLGSMRGGLHVGRVATWVRRHAFGELVGGMCRSYPEMKAGNDCAIEPYSAAELHESGTGCEPSDGFPDDPPAKARGEAEDADLRPADAPDGYLVSVYTPCDREPGGVASGAYLVAVRDPDAAERIVGCTIRLWGGWIRRVEPARPGDVREHGLEPGQCTRFGLPLWKARELQEQCLIY